MFSVDGPRYRGDTAMLCNICRSEGWLAEPIFYSDTENDEVSPTPNYPTTTLLYIKSLLTQKAIIRISSVFVGLLV